MKQGKGPRGDERRQSAPGRPAQADAARTSTRSQLRGKGYAEQLELLSPVQAKGGAPASRASVPATAARGVRGGGGPVPHSDRIQAAFGAHDISGVRAHVGGDAAAASRAIGANAYATGEKVAFAETPDLHTAAHEAAHVVQQRAGVSLEGGVGRAGDSYETHADQVADAVVSGRSAEGLLPASTGSKAPPSSVQGDWRNESTGEVLSDPAYEEQFGAACEPGWVQVPQDYAESARQ